MIDDWTDGMGETPDQVLARLRAGSGASGSHDMGGMDMCGLDMGGTDMGGTGASDTGDVAYPAYVIGPGEANIAPLSAHG